jgi:uncharacterized protein (TIGR03086 family)
VASLAAALDRTGAVVDLIGEAVLAERSVCDEWSVGDLLGHVVGVTEKFTSFARGETEAPRQSLVSDADLKVRYHAAARESVTAWSGDAVPNLCRLPFGTFDGCTAAAINAFDVSVHGWDLAQAVGASYMVDDSDAALALDVARLLVTTSARRDGHYRTEARVAASASIFDQVLALTGRSTCRMSC